MIVLAVMVMSICRGQDYKFTITDGEILYERIYETDMSWQDLLKQIYAKDQFGRIKELDSFMRATVAYMAIIEEKPTNGKDKYWKNYTGTVSGDITIEYKPGRYRVTMTNLFTHPPKQLFPWFMENDFKKGDRKVLESWKRDGERIIGNTLDRAFDYRVVKSDW